MVFILTVVINDCCDVRVGGERVLFMSAASWALVTAATPLMAKLSSHTVAVMTLARFLLGLLQGEYGTSPTMETKHLKHLFSIC